LESELDLLGAKLVCICMEANYKRQMPGGQATRWTAGPGDDGLGEGRHHPGCVQARIHSKRAALMMSLIILPE
jgi:hypothetical protein